jgi:hypothetical protein
VGIVTSPENENAGAARSVTGGTAAGRGVPGGGRLAPWLSGRIITLVVAF